MAKERVQKILAAAGYGSRRACEKFIQAGRVRVNGEIVTLGAKADPQKIRSPWMTISWNPKNISM